MTTGRRTSATAPHRQCRRREPASLTVATAEVVAPAAAAAAAAPA